MIAMIFQKLKRLWARPRAERSALFGSLIALPLLALALRLFGFKRVRAQLEKWTPLLPAVAPAVTPTQATAIAGMVNLAARRSLYKANCLKRSLLLWWILRRYHLDSQLRIGVRKGGTGLEAHAWVDLDGVVINDRLGFISTFKPFAGDVMTAYHFLD